MPQPKKRALTRRALLGGTVMTGAGAVLASAAPPSQEGVRVMAGWLSERMSAG